MSEALRAKYTRMTTGQLAATCQRMKAEIDNLQVMKNHYRDTPRYKGFAAEQRGKKRNYKAAKAELKLRQMKLF